MQEPLPAAVTRAGAIWRHSPAYIMPEHFHAQLEFLVVVRGWTAQRIARQTHVAHAGQIIWHLPSLPHEMVARSPDLDLRVIHIDPSLLLGLPQAGGSDRSRKDPFSGWLRGIGSLAAGRPVIELGRADFDALLEDCDSTFDDLWPDRDQTPRLRRLLANAWRATVTDHDATRANSIVELACALLLEDASLSRRELCRRLDVSEGYLSRCFDRELGLSFLEQRSRIRVARFAALRPPGAERGSFVEAALRAGFGSYEQLFRAFWKYVGQGPRAYLSGGGRTRIAGLTRNELDALARSGSQRPRNVAARGARRGPTRGLAGRRAGRG